MPAFKVKLVQANGKQAVLDVAQADPNDPNAAQTFTTGIVDVGVAVRVPAFQAIAAAISAMVAFSWKKLEVEQEVLPL